jgi:hypothetical protein
VILNGVLQPCSDASQVICPLVKVAIVEIVFLLENQGGHLDHHIHRERIVPLHHSPECITSNNIDVRGFGIYQLVRSIFVGFGVREWDCNFMGFLQ